MLTVKHTTDLNSPIYADSLAIRKKVFVTEQQVPIEIEVADEDKCIHFVLYNDESLPEATVRLLPKTKHSYKIQRMAVIKEARRKGYGKIIMQALESYAKENNLNELILGAQQQAIPFYESLGYQAFGPSYIEAGITHTHMKKSI